MAYEMDLGEIHESHGGVDGLDKAGGELFVKSVKMNLN